MKIHRLTDDNINRFIALNGLKPVTNLNALDKGVPAKGSLFDYDIFGYSMYERRNIPSYIDLKDRYLHPLVYSILKTINRNIESLILGTKNYIIDDSGKLVEDAINGGAGIDFLYENWDKIKFKDTESNLGKERLKNIKSRDRAFISKIIVLPAFFRDINTTEDGRISMDEINQKYLKILRLAETIHKQEQYGFIVNISRGRLQMALNTLHDDLINMHLHSKYSVFHHSVMGKNVTFGNRLVISASKIDNAERPEDVQVRFNRIGLPLAACCSAFFPFIVYGVREFLRNEFVHGGRYPYRDGDGNVKYTTLINPESYFSDEYIIKMINQFIFGFSTRFSTIDIPPNEDNVKAKIQLRGMFGKDKTSISRNMTWTDLLFVVATDVLYDKHIYATRYPIEDSYGINPSKISILSTTNTMPVLVGDKAYKHYPIVLPDQSSEGLFIDTMVLPSAYLIAYNADFDGDQMSCVGCYTNESNIEADAYTRDKKNMINLVNKTNRVVQRDLIQTFYTMTKHPIGAGIPVFKNLSRVANF